MGGKSSKDDVLLAAMDRLSEALESALAKIDRLEQLLEKKAKDRFAVTPKEITAIFLGQFEKTYGLRPKAKVR